ncbi:MAG: SGNH/GDSL hydrolase family protein [Planctomycetota bacterium]
MPEHPRRRGRIARRLGVLAGGSLLALAAGEIGLRLSGYEPLPGVIGPRHLFVRDPELGIRLRPGFRGVHATREFRVEVAVNSLGLRDREPETADSERLRILSLGDSFAYGCGVRAEETFARRLEEILSAGRPVRVYNGGAPSYGTRQELTLLRRLAPALHPDVVLVSFFFGNDLRDNVDPPLTERGGIVMTPYFGARVDESFLESLAVGRSDLLTLSILRWMELTEGLELPPPPTRPPADPAAVIETPTSPEVLAIPAPSEVEAAWQATAASLRELREAAAEAGARLVLIDIPILYQLDDALWRRRCERHRLVEAGYDRAAAAKRLAAFAGNLGIPLLDLAAAFAAEPDPEVLYFPINKHLSAAGHDAAARAIAGFLASAGVLDR